MISKTPAKNGKTTKVTFELPPGSASERACVCGEFNDWSQEANPLAKRKDGRFSATVTLATGKGYRFKYLLDDERWENDNGADEYVDNDYGSKDSVVIV